MTENRDIAITMMQLLANATGAEFKDEELAADIIEETLRKTTYIKTKKPSYK